MSKLYKSSLLLAVFWPFYVLPAAYATPGAWNSRELSDLFDQGMPGLVPAVATRSGVSAIPAAGQSLPGPHIDFDAYCRGRELCFLDTYMEELQGGTRMPGFIQDFYESFSNYGSPLNPGEEATIRGAVSGLNNTIRGRAICANLASSGRCDLEALAVGKIKFRAKVLDSGRYAETRIYAGEILVVINRARNLNNNSIVWIDTVGHELSHAEDYKKFKRDLIKKGGVNTEVKAYLTQLEIYNEIKGRDPRKLDKEVFDFMIQLWAWKENGGARPTTGFKDGKGRYISAEDAIRNFVGNARGGTSAIRNMVQNCFYASENLMNGDMSDLLVRELALTIQLHASEYNSWRKNNPSLATPGNQPVTPPNNNGDDDDGDDDSGGDGGGWNPTIDPHPGFDQNGNPIY